jgi:Tn3 transposase DDE domain
VLQVLRERLRCKEIWVVGANRYRNPDEDLPTDFEVQREQYYAALNLPQDVESFLDGVQREMNEALTLLDRSLPRNPHVKILQKRHGRIALSPLNAQPEPVNLSQLKSEILKRWPMTSLLDMLKETDLRTGFSKAFKSATGRESLDPATLQKRLLLCLYGLGTNTGLKRVSSGAGAESYPDLVHVRRRSAKSRSAKPLPRLSMGCFGSACLISGARRQRPALRTPKSSALGIKTS